MNRVDCCPCCYRTFDFKTFIPKLLPCCYEIWCLECISKLKKYTSVCAICTNNITINPKDMKTTELPMIVMCPNCKTEVKSRELAVDINQENPSIKCIKCSPNEEKIMLAINKILKSELETFRFVAFDYTADNFKSLIEGHVSDFVDMLLKDLINEIKKNISMRLLSIIEKEIEINNETFKLFHKFANMWDNLKEIQQITPEKLPVINEHLQFYSKEFSNVLIKATSIINIEQMIKNNNIISLSKPIKGLENEILKAISLNIGENLENKIQINAYDDDFSGISDKLEKVNSLFKENEHLKQFINELDLEIKFYRNELSSRINCSCMNSEMKNNEKLNESKVGNVNEIFQLSDTIHLNHKEFK